MVESLTSHLNVFDPASVDGSPVEHQAEVSLCLEGSSGPYVVRWNRLISSTNWEKGQIIGQWRQALIDAGAPSTEYTDDAWARNVGGVSGQHVRRLRRVFDRFGQVYQQYEGLYWSHFHAALDWDDAELWLEGAVQSGWSVSQMRRQRWEAMGALPDQQPKDEDIVAADTDEDCDPALDRDDAVARRTGDSDSASGPLPEGPDFGDEDSAAEVDQGRDALDHAESAGEGSMEFVRPFENLAELPQDLAEAFESFKLAILRHKTDQWRQIPRDDVLASLDALKELVVAPSLE
jgi:hypothetical protein